MRMCYLSSARIPDSWGHVLQIMQMCEAFANDSTDVTLLVPRRGSTVIEDPFAYAGVAKVFTIKKIWCLDLFPGTTGRFLYWARTLSFYISARIYLSVHHFDFIYTREHLAALFVPNCLCEIHAPARDSRINRFALARLRGIVALTAGIRNIIESRGYPARRITVEPDAVRLESFENNLTQEDARSALKIPLDDFIVGYVGTLKTMGMEKGVGAMIQALPLVQSPIVFWVIGGEPVEIEEYKRLANDLGVENRVVFTGKVPHARVVEYLRSFDVAVAPFPDYEHYRLYMSPLKIFEYMAAGVPMIVSDLASLREVLTERTAKFVEAGNKNELARAVEEIFKNPAEAHQLAANARNEIQRYTWNARAERITRFYKALG